MSGITDILLYPMNALFALVGRYPWPSVAVCLAGAVGFALLGRDVWSVSFVLFGSTVLIWIDEHFHPRHAHIGEIAD